MPRCSCDGGKCSCLVLPGAGVQVEGSGSATNPYVISATTDITSHLEVADTSSVDMHATGSGTEDDPLVISADVTMDLDDLGDVDAPSPAVGDTVSWNGSQWVSGPPPVVPAGAVNVGPGLTGTGAVDAPLAAAVSGVWGVDPLDDYGPDSTVGLVVYVDSNGQLRAEPREPVVAWDDITGRPSTYPTTWAEISGKPTSWAVTHTTTSLTAAAGWRVDWSHTYRAGNIVTCSFAVTRTGAAITSPASNGNMANTAMATITTTMRPYHYAPFHTSTAGPLMTGYVDSSGVMRLTATVPDYRFATGAQLAFVGTWVTRGG